MTTPLIFQIVGTVLSASATIHKLIKGNAVQSPATPKPEKENLWRRIVKQPDWVFIVGGMLVTIVALILQSNKTETASIRAQNQSSNQLQLIKTTLNGVYRIVTRFDEISLSITYELPKSNYFVPLFDKYCNSLPGASDTNTNSGYSLGLAGYLMTNTSVVTFSILSNSPEFSISLPTNGDFALINSNSDNAEDLRYAIKFFCNPKLLLSLSSTKHAGAYLGIHGTNLLRSANLVYRSRNHQILIEWVFDCPKSCWKQTKQISALPDLANAKMTHYVLDGVPEWLEPMKPLNAVLYFDGNAVRVDKFVESGKIKVLPSEKAMAIAINRTNHTRISESYLAYLFERECTFDSDLPDEDEILSNQ